MDPTRIRELIDLVESKNKLELEKLPYGRGSLAPVMSRATIDNHYGKLAQGYVDRYNRGEGDAAFNEAGAFLHNIFFTQLRPPRDNNSPQGASLNLINRKFKSFSKFKEEMKEEALKIQGSGWIYLSRSGDIKVIRNHAKRAGIVLLIDWWEHAYVHDYGADKKKYFDRIWRCINWNVVNTRINSGG